jgi:aminoglycoside 6'-N-acetyltransferase
LDVIAREQTLVIRRMRPEHDDYERMVRWRNEPHVREWWDPDEPPLSLEEAEREYGPQTQPDSALTACVIEHDGHPVGYVQFYPWLAEDTTALDIPPFDDQTWGLDIFVGEPELVGRDIGSRSVDLVCRYLYGNRGASAVALVAAKANRRALRAYEKAGFQSTASVLDTDTRDGLRVESWLMVRQRPESLDHPIA